MSMCFLQSVLRCFWVECVRCIVHRSLTYRGFARDVVHGFTWKQRDFTRYESKSSKDLYKKKITLV